TINDFLVNGWGTKIVDGWADWIDKAETTGDLIGRAALGASAGQTLAMDTTSVNFYRLVRAAIAARPGRKTIITDEANFPTDRYIMQGIADELGLNLVVIPNDLQEHEVGKPFSDERVTPAILKPYLTDDVALVTLSVVAYRSGALHNIKELTDLVRANGTLLVWDASHAVGAVDMQFDLDGVDLAVGCTYKYGNSGPGSPAWLYVSKRLQSELQMPIQGWFAQRNQFLMGSKFEQIEGMRGFQIASPSIIGLLCIDEGFGMIEAASISAINAKASKGTDMMIELFDQWLAPLGFELVTPRDSKLRGGHISIYHPAAAQIARGLRDDMKVIPDYRAPNSIRVAISPLATSFVEVFEGFERIRDYTKSGKYKDLDLSHVKVS
ncbi:MAG: aminotransferase class V-fold PLP-dependent enzyme, partial [Actinobacteria bacterium]|nr:aminotransferase class V-fold PLP-dependent enzyme [Actinomycetota bacterium]MSX29953.1 aminotransferase class V-fold PLP-dependent enzyme [Actinomycetota bacterium]